MEVQDYFQLVDKVKALQAALSALWVEIDRHRPSFVPDPVLPPSAQVISDDSQLHSPQDADVSAVDRDPYRKWLSQNGVAVGIDAYLARLSLFESATGQSIDRLLEDYDLRHVLNMVHARTFPTIAPGMLRDIRSAITKYHTYLHAIG